MLLLRLRFCEQAKLDSILDVGTGPKTHERRRVVGIETCHGIRRDLVERRLGSCVHTEDSHVHAENFMAFHRFVDIERHRAEIFADDLHVVAV